MGVEVKRVLVTGAAGFIGAALSYKLLEMGMAVIGIDNLNTYYDPNLKKSRIKIIDDDSAKNSFKTIGEGLVNKKKIDIRTDKKKIYYSDLNGNHMITRQVPIFGLSGTSIFFNGYKNQLNPHTISSCNVVKSIKLTL